MINIGIIGNGFVGAAVAHGFSLFANIRTHDKDQRLSTHTFDEVVSNSDYIFVCVPTPMSTTDGSIDLSILDSVVEKIAQSTPSTSTTVIIKSTVIPGTTQKYIEQYPDLRIVFNPEFLSERTAKLDFMCPARIVIGGTWEAAEPVEKMYRERFPHTQIIATDASSAEFIKYMCNCFFAVKIAAFNEFHQMATAQGLSWPDIEAGLLSSGWVNPMHTMVPGTDGDYGFGGKCFPKDLNAFIKHFENNNIEPSMMKAAWQKNLEVRHNHDWLLIDGAVSTTQGKLK